MPKVVRLALNSIMTLTKIELDGDVKKEEEEKLKGLKLMFLWKSRGKEWWFERSMVRHVVPSLSLHLYLK